MIRQGFGASDASDPNRQRQSQEDNQNKINNNDSSSSIDNNTPFSPFLSLYDSETFFTRAAFSYTVSVILIKSRHHNVCTIEARANQLNLGRRSESRQHSPSSPLVSRGTKEAVD